jgi:hypothetical protein
VVGSFLQNDQVPHVPLAALAFLNFIFSTEIESLEQASPVQFNGSAVGGPVAILSMVSSSARTNRDVFVPASLFDRIVWCRPQRGRGWSL